MDQVFAPWRIEWVERESKNEDVECIFCEYPERETAREHRVVARSAHAAVMLNNYPYSPGHCLVIPETHTGDYAELSTNVLLEHAQMKQATFDALSTAFNPDGFNAGLNLGSGAGGSIDDHLHTHVVPRWNEDTNFMPIISDTKVIVEALSDSYDRLHEAFSAHDSATTEESTAGSSAGGAVQLNFD